MHLLRTLYTLQLAHKQEAVCQTLTIRKILRI